MSAATCDHGYEPGKCPDDLCLNRREVKNALLGLVGAMTAADDQARAMTDAELGTLLTTGRWTTIEVYEAGRRLLAADVRREWRENRAG